MMTIAEERVARGAALLDAKGPANWRALIDRGVLTIASSIHCICGQLYGGDYSRGFEALGIGGCGHNYGFVALSAHAFTAYVSCRELDAAWLKELDHEPVGSFAAARTETLVDVHAEQPLH